MSNKHNKNPRGKTVNRKHVQLKALIKNHNKTTHGSRKGKKFSSNDNFVREALKLFLAPASPAAPKVDLAPALPVAPKVDQAPETDQIDWSKRIKILRNDPFVRAALNLPLVPSKYQPLRLTTSPTKAQDPELSQNRAPIDLLAATSQSSKVASQKSPIISELLLKETTKASALQPKNPLAKNELDLDGLIINQSQAQELQPHGQTQESASAVAPATKVEILPNQSPKDHQDKAWPLLLNQMTIIPTLEINLSTSLESAFDYGQALLKKTRHQSDYLEASKNTYQRTNFLDPQALCAQNDKASSDPLMDQLNGPTNGEAEKGMKKLKNKPLESEPNNSLATSSPGQEPTPPGLQNNSPESQEPAAQDPESTKKPLKPAQDKKGSSKAPKKKPQDETTSKAQKVGKISANQSSQHIEDPTLDEFFENFLV
ncbi:MAG: hypothetical protein LBE80_09700, partial [Deltaproteobacteria bacterium]|nr:hypothetical protein [Deltaproteobacteria bacterium]